MLIYHVFHRGVILDRNTWIIKDQTKSQIIYTINTSDDHETDIYDDSDTWVASLRGQDSDDWSIKLKISSGTETITLTATHDGNVEFEYLGHKYCWRGTEELVDETGETVSTFQEAVFPIKKVGDLEIYGMVEGYERLVLTSFVAVWEYLKKFRLVKEREEAEAKEVEGEKKY